MSASLHEAWFAAFERKSLSDLENILADDFVHKSPFGEIKGKDVYIDLVRENADAFFAKTITIADVMGEGDRVAVQYAIDEFEACDCIYSSGNKIVRINSYYHFGKKPSFD